jgi:HSP20 family protein
MAWGRFLESRHGPFGELQHEINDLFDGLLSRFGRSVFGHACPPTNVVEETDAMVVECELPGADGESLELTVAGDVLTLKGTRPALEPAEGTTVHIHERGYGTFSRAITLPAPIDGEKVEAHYEHGILSVRLPKAPEAKPKQVPVRGS